MILHTLSDYIEYLPATEEPLSANIGIIHGEVFDWIYDVGCSEEACLAIQMIQKKKNVILSHFHQDHAGNIEKITYENLYCSNYTKQKVNAGIVVSTSAFFDDGIKIRIFPLPSLHSKGTIGMEVNKQFAFLGDAIYGTTRNGVRVYNVSVLKEMIIALEAVSAPYFLISHSEDYLQPKEKIIGELKSIYNRRTPGNLFV